MPKKILELSESNVLFGIIIFWEYLCLNIFKTMSSNSSQNRVRQWTEASIEATKAREENRQVIIERNVVKANVMISPFSFIDQMIQ
jgi:hypothetical protein